MIPDEYLPPEPAQRKRVGGKALASYFTGAYRSQWLRIGVLVLLVGVGSAALCMLNLSGIKARVLAGIAQTCPDEGGAYSVLKKHYDVSDSSAGAVETCERLVELKPLDAYAHTLLGDAYTDAGRIPEAIASYREALTLDAECFEALLGMGKAQSEMGDYPAAIASYRQALQLRPESADAHLSLGLALSSAGQYEEAMQAFQRAKELDPGVAETQVITGKAFLQVGMYAQAIECLQDAIHTNDAHAQAYFNLGRAYLRVGDAALAMEQQRILQNLDPRLAEQLRRLIEE